MKTFLEADAEAIGRWVTRVVKSPEAHELLGPMIPDRKNSWTQGGCCVLAMALQEYLGRGKLMMMTRGGTVVHVLLELGGVLIDAEGAHTKAGVESAWTNPMGAPANVVPFDAGLADQSGVRCPDPGPFVWYLERIQPRMRFYRSGSFDPTQRVDFGRRTRAGVRFSGCGCGGRRCGGLGRRWR